MSIKYVFNPTTGNLDATDKVAFNGEVNAGSAASPSIFFTGDTNTGIYSPGADQLALSTNSTQRLLIDASGNVNIDSNTLYVDATNNRVGIGTSAPSSILHANGDVTIGSTNPTIVKANGGINFAGNYNGILSKNSTYVYLGSTNNSVALWPNNGTNANPGLIVDSANRVGIGTQSPSVLLHVQDDSLSSTTPGTNIVARFQTNGANRDASILLGDATNSASRIGQNNGSLTFHPGSATERARIDSSGRLLIGTSSGSSRLTVNSGEDSVSDRTVGAIRATVRRNGGPIALRLEHQNQGGAASGINTGPSIGFFGYDGTNPQQLAEIAALSDNQDVASGDSPGRLVFSVTADGASSPTEALRISNNRAITVSDGGNVVLGTTTGTKIGTATTQKLGFYNATPVVQPAAVADATDAATVITQLNDLLAKLRTLGIIAT